MLHHRELLHRHTLVSCGLNEEYIVWLGPEFKDHSSVVKLRSSVSASDLCTAIVAPEKKDVEGISLGNELLLRQLLLTPKFNRLGSVCLLTMALACLNMRINCRYPVAGLSFIISFKFKLAVIASHSQHELLLFALVLRYEDLIKIKVESANTLALSFIDFVVLQDAVFELHVSILPAFE